MDYDCKDPATPNAHYFVWQSDMIGETVPHWARCQGCDRTNWEITFEPQTQGPKVNTFGLLDVQAPQGDGQQ